MFWARFNTTGGPLPSTSVRSLLKTPPEMPSKENAQQTDEMKALASILPHACSELRTASEFLAQAFPGSGALNGVDDAACNSSIPQLGASQRAEDKKMCDALLKEKCGKLLETRIYA